ncbi:flagellar protein FlgN [Carboxydocella sp. ULO1]|uniref:flagellar protein FlgN n=1 Tax=Carboxydocella sp. ULO1 TaxID=1926599 RepID=UPI0009AC1AF6|nr:flagellar protein FlgN [Carboxydocella sp. ULO1]GAW27660.1 flagellar protein FlgN [Carboxydocella sp. ULO1]
MATAAGVLQELTQVLAGQRDVYGRLLSLAREKQEALVRGDLPVIEQIVAQEEQLVVQVGKLEEARNQLVEALATELGLEDRQLTISKLLELGAGDTSRLQGIAVELTHVLEDLGKVNEQNKQLLQQSLKYLDFTVNLLAGQEDLPVYHGKEGNNPGERPPARLFDKKV